MQSETKRLFFGIEVSAPWPESLPYGRTLKEEHRHLTLAFLGKTDYPKMQKELGDFPHPHFKVGLVGKFDQCLFLPPRHPRVVAWHVDWLEESSVLLQLYESVVHWLQKKEFQPDLHHQFTPHVTMARSPFNERVWQKKFTPLPLILKDIHLYESLGNLHYQSIWRYPILAPFEEIDHTADIAYLIRAENFDQLYQHAFIALCFTFPLLLSFFQKKEGLSALEEVIIELNHIVTHSDQEIGCPFKAVSFHSHLEYKENILHWEMIIDV